MKYLNKQATVLIICVVAICVLCISTVSYAYFTTQIIGNDTAKEMVVETGDVEITYTDSNEVNVSELLPGDYITKTFKVTNTGTLEAKYNIKIDVEINDFEDYSDLTYTITKDGTQEGLEKVLPYEDGYILKEEILNNQNDVHNYTLTIKFKKDDSNQNDNLNKKVNFKIEIDNKEGVNLYEYKEPYKDSSGANRPKLYQGLIPITYNDDNTMKIADITSEWYNYDAHKWGNAVLIDNTNPTIRNKFYDENGKLKINETITENDILQMYVWIPRYKYQLFNANNEVVPEQMINISFEKGVTSTGNVSCEYINEGNGTIREDCQNAENGNWYTHPAFTFGDTELSGIWVGKFEPSDFDDYLGNKKESIIKTMTIIPNKISATMKGVKIMFDSSRAIEKNEKYSLNSAEIDTHMMKNMEWGAVAYFSNSKYGIYNNDGKSCVIDGCQIYKNNYTNGSSSDSYSGTVTGCVESKRGDPVVFNATSCSNYEWNTLNGIKASTTGNVFGIYDMAGGTWEHVMGGTVYIDGKFYSSSSGFVDKNPGIGSKYYDLYSYYADSVSIFPERGHLGDATREVIKSNINYTWNNNGAGFPSNTNSWFSRGGSFKEPNSGIFGYWGFQGWGRNYVSFRVVLTAQDGNE